MASKSQHEASVQQEFQEFFTKWRKEQNSQLQELVAAAKPAPQPQPVKDSLLRGLIERVMTHYEEYYQVKSKCAEQHILLILSPPWNTLLGDAFLWIGGWRPSAAFHLIYSLSGLQLEAEMSRMSAPLEIESLEGLSSGQMGRIDALQKSTISEERKITEDMAKQQEKVAGVEMVELSHEVSESIRMQRVMNLDLDATLKPIKEGFQRILRDADDLRQRTFKEVINILWPIQGVHFLIAAAELHLRVHDWGKDKEENRAGD